MVKVIPICSATKNGTKTINNTNTIMIMVWDRTSLTSTREERGTTPFTKPPREAFNHLQHHHPTPTTTTTKQATYIVTKNAIDYLPIRYRIKMLLSSPFPLLIQSLTQTLVHLLNCSLVRHLYTFLFLTQKQTLKQTLNQTITNPLHNCSTVLQVRSG